MDVMVVFMQMVQLFSLMAVGYLLYCLKIFDKSFNKKLTAFLLSVTMPSMIVVSILSQEKVQKIEDIIFAFVLGVIIYLLLPVIGYVIAKIVKVPQEQVGLYMFMNMFSNVGFMGYPVMNAIYGPSAIFYTSIFNMIFNLFLYSTGRSVMRFGYHENEKINMKNFINPGIVASLIAIVFYFAGLRLPTLVLSTLDMLGDMTTPLAMMIIGSTLATIPLKDVFNERSAYAFALVKQVIFPVIAFPILNILIKDSLLLGVALIMISMPVGNSAVLFATQYGGDEAVAAKNIFMTTLISVITIPLIVALYLI